MLLEGRNKFYIFRKTVYLYFSEQWNVFKNNAPNMVPIPHNPTFIQSSIKFLPPVFPPCQVLTTVKVRLSGNSSIGKVALAVYFHRAHYNSPMALAAYFCHYPALHGISRAVLKVSESSTGGTARTDQLTRRPCLVFIIAHIKIAYRRLPFSLTAESIYRHTPFPKRAR
jgi:hypothetical protein